MKYNLELSIKIPKLKLYYNYNNKLLLKGYYDANRAIDLVNKKSIISYLNKDHNNFDNKKGRYKKYKIQI